MQIEHLAWYFTLLLSRQTRFDSQSNESYVTISTLQAEKGELLQVKDSMFRYIRELEQINDDLERGKRWGGLLTGFYLGIVVWGGGGKLNTITRVHRGEAWSFGKEAEEFGGKLPYYTILGNTFGIFCEKFWLLIKHYTSFLSLFIQLFMTSVWSVYIMYILTVLSTVQYTHCKLQRKCFRCTFNLSIEFAIQHLYIVSAQQTWRISTFIIYTVHVLQVHVQC